MNDKFEDDMKNLKGTFAAEGMTVSDRVIANLKRAYDGEVTYAELIEDVKKRYMQRD